MNISGPIKTLIDGDTTANAIFAGRIYPDILPDKSTYPAAVVNIVNTLPTNSKTNASGLDFVLIQVDVYGTTLTSVADGIEAIRGAIDYQTTGSLQHIEFRNAQSGFSGKPELFRWITEYSAAYQRN